MEENQKIEPITLNSHIIYTGDWVNNRPPLVKNENEPVVVHELLSKMAEEFRTATNNVQQYIMAQAALKVIKRLPNNEKMLLTEWYAHGFVSGCLNSLETKSVALAEMDSFKCLWKEFTCSEKKKYPKLFKSVFLLSKNNPSSNGASAFFVPGQEFSQKLKLINWTQDLKHFEIRSLGLISNLKSLESLLTDVENDSEKDKEQNHRLIKAIEAKLEVDYTSKPLSERLVILKKSLVIFDYVTNKYGNKGNIQKHLVGMFEDFLKNIEVFTEKEIDRMSSYVKSAKNYAPGDELVKKINWKNLLDNLVKERKECDDTFGYVKLSGATMFALERFFPRMDLPMKQGKFNIGGKEMERDTPQNFKNNVESLISFLKSNGSLLNNIGEKIFVRDEKPIGEINNTNISWQGLDNTQENILLKIIESAIYKRDGVVVNGELPSDLQIMISDYEMRQDLQKENKNIPSKHKTRKF